MPFRRLQLLPRQKLLPRLFYHPETLLPRLEPLPQQVPVMPRLLRSVPYRFCRLGLPT
jgi:hypothetical protein